ncbi:hypothetical protein KEM60_00921 [Austwickia sp. TVS 96-490-7B]|uniref:hypothetical protein n=1 Tax=Austwickia sp. TVS 96-490-7B TaxID=2830843 RepID=UPI001C572A96|nr:hypothetical protein [Austwickia sp. TVS 96-490-7B]MBW3084732.1 hypothetical protein [Austwickia sp. TVS 96-490-7B]
MTNAHPEDSLAPHRHDTDDTPPTLGGPHLPAIAAGVFAVLSGIVVLWQGVTGQIWNWASYLPALIAVIGIMMILTGIWGMLRRHQ